MLLAEMADAAAVAAAAERDETVVSELPVRFASQRPPTPAGVEAAAVFVAVVVVAAHAARCQRYCSLDRPYCF